MFSIVTVENKITALVLCYVRVFTAIAHVLEFFHFWSRDCDRFDKEHFLFLGVEDNIYSTPEEEENHEYRTLIPNDNLQIQGKQLFASCSISLNDIIGLKSVLDIEAMILTKTLFNSGRNQMNFKFS